MGRADNVEFQFQFNNFKQKFSALNFIICDATFLSILIASQNSLKTICVALVSYLLPLPLSFLPLSPFSLLPDSVNRAVEQYLSVFMYL